MSTESVMFSLRIPRELAEQIGKIADAERRSRNGQIVLFLDEAVSRPITDKAGRNPATPRSRRGERAA